jgi:hypothetical protein
MPNQPLSQHEALLANLLLLLFPAIALIGAAVMLTSGFFLSKRTRLSKRAAAHAQKELIKWGLIRSRRGFGSQAAQELLLAWERTSTYSCWGMCGSLLALSLIGGAAILAAPLTPGTTSEAGARALLIFTSGFSELFYLGVFLGISLGLLFGASRAARSAPDAAISHPFQQYALSEYRAPTLVLLPTLLLVFDAAIALGAMFSLSGFTTWAVLLGMVVFPTATLLLCVLGEWLTRRVLRLPALRLTSEPHLARRADEKMRARMIGIIFGLECGAVGWLAFTQLCLFSIFVAGKPGIQGGGFLAMLLTLAGTGMFLVMGITSVQGRLGGARTGWPWQRPTARFSRETTLEDHAQHTH